MSCRPNHPLRSPHYEERSISEIGAATGLDDGTVKSHLFRAARKLRQKLEDLR